MHIEKVETFVVSQKLEETFYFSQHHYDTRTLCLTRVTLDNGVSGWGEGYGPAHPIKEGIQFLAPLILKQSPLEQEKLWQSMYLRSLDHARSGILLSALSALDIALWDLKGKILEQPVSVLLGGRRRESVRAYATGMYFSKPENMAGKLAEEARGYRDQGFSAVKMKVGLGLEEDHENVRAVREALGSEVVAGLLASHSLLPPTPGPLAAAGILGAEIGRVILINIPVALFAAGGGLLWAVYYCRRHRISYDETVKERFQADEEGEEERDRQPGFVASVVPIVLPLVLIAAGALVSAESGGRIASLIEALGTPLVALLIGFLAAVVVLRQRDYGTSATGSAPRFSTILS